MDLVQVRFLDNIVTPWRKLNALLSDHPLAAKPDSNGVIASAQALAVTLNHFRENNPETGGDAFPISDDLRNFANSVKHKKGAETAVRCYLTPSYECAGGKFRFIKNRIVCKYEKATGANKGREFLASDQIWATIQRYAQAIGVDVSQFAPTESRYDFLRVAVAFYVPELSAYTDATQITMLKKGISGYEPVAPELVKFMVLSADHIGEDLSNLDIPSGNPK